MKRILITVHKFFPAHKAGTEVLTLKVAQELQRRGYEILVVTGNPPDLDARVSAIPENTPETSNYEYGGIKVHALEEPLRLQGFTFAHEFLNPAIMQHFKKLLKSYAPDIVHIFHAQNLSAGIIEVAEEANIPVVMSTTDFWFVCPVVQLKRPDGAVCRGPDKLASNCLTCFTPKLFPHVSEFQEAFSGRYKTISRKLNRLPSLLSTIAWKSLYATYAAGKLPSAVSATTKRPGVLRKLANATRAIMVPTKLMKDIFVENGIREELIHQVPFGIDTAPLLPFQNKSPANKIRFGYIGTLFEHKGVDLLVDAFQQLPAQANATLTIYGNLKQFPAYGERLQVMVARNLPNSEKISFAGTFPIEKLGEVLSTIDVLVVPSRWYENTPLVIQSALTCKTPLIATDLGGMSELINHGHNGLLFKLNDASSLAKQLQMLLDNPEKIAEFRQNIPPERDVSQMVDDIEVIYHRTCPEAFDESAKERQSQAPVTTTRRD